MLKEFDLSRIKLRQDSEIFRKMILNEKYILSLDLDRILHTTRLQCGVESRVKPYGGWENPEGGVRGQFIGHYVKACINMFNYYKDTDRSVDFLSRVEYIIEALYECQESYGNGYLNAIPESQFDFLEEMKDPVRGGVPYYVSHKMFVAVLEAYKSFGFSKALEIAIKMADYYEKRLEKFSQSELDIMFNTRRYPTGFFKEFGGMYEALLDLYEITGEKRHMALGKKFDRKWFNDMLYRDEDLLAVNKEHVNSEIPVIKSMIKHYKMFGDPYYKTGVENFMKWMENGHVFPTGGLSGASAYKDYGAELFTYPNLFYDHITTSPGHKSNHSGESCCSHNMNIINQKIFKWDKNIDYMHQFEKRYVNAVLSQQHPDTGMFIYNQDLKFGSFKEWGSEEDAFWCCYCTGIEAFSSLAEGAYYYENNHLYITNYLDSDLSFDEMNAHIKMKTNFPTSGSGCIQVDSEHEILIHLRVPKWAGKKSYIKLDDKTMKMTPGEFAILKCKDSTIEFNFEYTLSSEPMPDRPEYISISYGPHVLVACGHESIGFTGGEKDLLASFKPFGKDNHFRVQLGPIEDDELAVFKGTKTITYKPISEIVDEIYNGYTRISEPRKEVIVGSIDIHHLKGKALEMTELGLTGKEITFEVNIDSDKLNYIKMWYSGDETDFKDMGVDYIRLFDFEIIENGKLIYTVATQHLMKESPGLIYDVIYPIPIEQTRKKKKLQIRIRKKDFMDYRRQVFYKGIIGSLLDKIQIHTYGGTYE
ncbi:hypothetical protein EZV73_05615 [Acidaminobacter sp. JC074]|uniref:beta-L-arabinofuranosidase domain-containing protein n=1 Tax=Acidaminobacter sp. JC074 TaxID=2530199 RepID=UPI001F0F138D|nr:beta-L-arabinofuranosidase domain-containing protein [Acidaminobacter sp. JC074]MCH4887035.1 hypothetical protein [Acidaminobacter sp. JC074]